jgi:hypothetical protein
MYDFELEILLKYKQFLIQLPTAALKPDPPAPRTTTSYS